VVHALYRPDGGSRAFVKVLRDETTRKRTEELMLAAKEAAERANRAKDDFLATLGHELRTPLSTIMIWGQLLRARATGDQQAEGLDAILRSARAQKKLLDDLLDTSRITHGKLRLELTEVDPAAIVRTTIDGMRPAADAKGVEIQTFVPNELGTLWADPARLRQVVWNLLTNAVKFTPSGGWVRVVAQRTNDAVRIRVEDSGEGIGVDFLPHVFEPFRQEDASTTRSHGGLGLGLAICRQIVEHHGGRIEVRSDGVGRGTAVTVQLPLRRLPTQSLPPDPPVGLDMYANTLAAVHVLLVEDDADTRSSLEAVLRGASATVTAVDSAGAALEVFERTRPHVIVSDVGMKRVDGYSLMRRVREIEAGGPRIPAIALTAFAGDASRRDALEAGFDLHVGKPVEPAALLRTLVKLGRGAA
jgi:CheY-like chemotaxis protein